MTDRAREVLEAKYKQIGFSGLPKHSDWVECALDAMNDFAAEREAAVMEACAKIADAINFIPHGGDVARVVATRIRSRSTEASAPQPMAGECDHLWTPDLRGGVVCAKCKAFVEHKIVVPSQPDTGTKDWRLELANVFRAAARGAEDAIDGFVLVADNLEALALQRLSKGKNDGR